MASAEEEGPADRCPDAAARELINSLRPEQIRAIDEAILHVVGHRWRKVARIVGTAMVNDPGRVHGIPDVFYSERVATLVAQGRLELHGDLSRMRYSEVRIPQASGA